MIDREKVIKGLEYCSTPGLCTGCVYHGEHCTINMYADAIKLLKEQPQWISVKDRLPDEKQSKITHDFEYVLCATTFGEVRAYKFGTPIGWSEPHFWHGAGKMDKYVTHWMPLPEPPKEESDD